MVWPRGDRLANGGAVEMSSVLGQMAEALAKSSSDQHMMWVFGATSD